MRLVHRGASGEPEDLEIEVDGRRFSVREPGGIVRGDAAPLPDGRLSLLFEDGRQICGRLVRSKSGEVELAIRAGIRRIALAEPLQDRLAHADAEAGASSQDEEIRALMPGRVVEISVEAGRIVPPGALVLVLEAMKMQNEIRTARGGLVARIAVGAGSAVEGGALLALIQPAPDTSAIIQ